MSEEITGADLIKLIPFAGGLAALIYFLSQAHRKSGMINPDIEKDKAKVSTLINIEDIGEKVSLCRCWKSKKFPYCDGAHREHNSCTGDNVGPVTIKRTAPTS